MLKAIIKLNFSCNKVRENFEISTFGIRTRESRSRAFPVCHLKNKMFSKASMNHKSHMGHDHSALPYEWTFGMGTQDKIIKAMIRSKKEVLIGLNAFEQSLLNEYEIRYGNIFQTTIKGHRFLIEKTTSGIKVVGHVDVQKVAMNNNNYENM